jgi:hypothetical protein
VLSGDWFGLGLSAFCLSLRKLLGKKRGLSTSSESLGLCEVKFGINTKQ